MGLPTTIYPPQTDYSLILYWGHGNYDQNMYYPCISDIHFSTTYHMSIYDVIHKTLCHTHAGISTAEDMGEYSPRDKGM